MGAHQPRKEAPNMFPTTYGGKDTGKEAGKDARRDAPDHPGNIPGNSGNDSGNVTHLLLPRPLLPYQRRRPIENQNSGKNGK